MIDSVVEYGKQLASLSAEIDRLDGEQLDHTSAGRMSEALAAQRKQAALFDRRHAVEAMIATTQATSLQGAAVQVMLANSMAGIAEGDPQPEFFRQIQSCLYSVVAAMGEITGRDLSEFGGAVYMAKSLDPFIAHQQEAA